MPEETVAVEQEALVVMEGVAPVTALSLFTQPDEAQRILGDIRKAACSEVADLSTGVSRDRVKSRARQLSTIKKQFDDAGKLLVDDAKKLIKVVDPARKVLRDGCDAIRDEIRKPVTEWEIEQKKQEALRKLIADWDDALIEDENFTLRRRIADQEAEEKRLKDEAEAARLKAIEDERLATEREKEAERVRVAAVEQAKADVVAAIQKAQDEAAQAIQAKKDAEARVEEQARVAREAAAQAREDAISAERERLERAEANRIATEHEEAERTRLAAEQAEKEKEAAVQAERERIEQERKAEEARQATLQANQERKDVCEMAAVDALAQAGIVENDASVVVELISNGRVPHLRFDYSTDAESS